MKRLALLTLLALAIVSTVSADIPIPECFPCFSSPSTLSVAK